jgi:DNA-binding NtrC family response regulator
MVDLLDPGDVDSGTSAAVQTEPLEDEGRAPQAERLCLQVLFDYGRPYLRELGAGGLFPFNPKQEPFLLGRDTRSSDGRLLLEDRSVSRHHVEVQVSEDDDAIQLRTLDAKNDTYVDGVLVRGPCRASKGAVLRIGGSLLLVSSIPSSQPWAGARDIPGLRGTSPALNKVRWNVTQRADAPTPVVIWGESGVGKELVAEALHSQSQRRDKPFVKVNCATLSPALAGSELFGHERGAFTGANRTTRGLFGEAAGGTLFLDEIHWLAPDVQGQLLRALESGKVRATGASQEQEHGVRVVAASNRDLRTLSDNTHPPFLADLRARLGDWYRIHIPPLRERREDILPIFVELLTNAATLRGRPWLLDLRISWRLTDLLLQRAWPNNVRDLRTVAQALVDLTPEDAKSLSVEPLDEFLPPQPAVGAEATATLSAEALLKTRRKKSQRLTDQDEAEVRESLARNRGNFKATEAETGVHERTIRRLTERWRAEARHEEDDSGG